MTTLKTLFEKQIDRPIEGVVKADDEASLRLEIEEYVLTNEVAKRLESFLEEYNHYEGANGVWVSGFFGSGKSHLLKILALLLENRHIDGVPALDLFLPKCGDNEILRGDLKRAAAIPSKSILFNIDQKADVISKKQVDALLAVFVKVFDEMCGYYGKQGHVARFERDLDNRGLYGKFKSAFEVASGCTWEQGREQALLEAGHIATAYAAVTGSEAATAQGILDRYYNEYCVSIGDFAEQVNYWIEQQSAREGQQAFRLNFFVDEVGQYIADNVKLMTNLQTIAESLATRCRGRAWVVVTAQEDMTAVVGEMGKRQGNDFSKIQARFANRMKLTSADVDEVIQKRLLTKTEQGIQQLSGIHQDQSNNFKTLFDFADGSQTYRNFQDRDHFIRSYPFIPYQFPLFQAAIQNLSQHNAFEGKHSSVGERSMLGVFQQVVVSIADIETGRLATFDLMFEGIRSALKSDIQRAIIQAEGHLGDPFAIRLLKALFLVKYVKEFKPSPRNLRILMQERFDQDVPAFRQRVEEALNLLEQQTYVQRNGELFEYLTDEEKDIEVEIKNTDIESSDLTAELEKIVFDHVIKHSRIRYGKDGPDYPFSKKLDDHLRGREQELAINVITPFHEYSGNEENLRMQSMSRDELLTLMPPDEWLVRNLLMYKRTEKYIRQSMSIAQQETVKRILVERGRQNQERHAGLQNIVKNLLGKAKLIVAGADVDINSEDAQARVIAGFQQLINHTYSNLAMLRGVTYSENDITVWLERSQQELSVYDPSEPEQELMAFIRNNKQRGLRTTLKNILEKFEHKPYGWPYAAVLCTLAKLYAREKIECRVDGNLLEGSELEQALRNSRGHGNVVLEPQVEFSAAQVRALKQFFEDFFDSPPRAGEAKALSEETNEKFKVLGEELKTLADQLPDYPFLEVLTQPLNEIRQLIGKPYGWYLTDLTRMEDTLLDMKEGIIDPVCRFMNGPQRGIFDEAHRFTREQKPNFGYLEANEAAQVPAILSEPECFKGHHMQQLKRQVELLQAKIDTRIQVEISNAKKIVTGLKNRLYDMDEFSSLDKQQQDQITCRFDEFDSNIAEQSLIAVIRDTVRQFEEHDYQGLLSRIADMAQVAQIPDSISNVNETITPDNTATPRSPEYILSRAVPVPFAKVWLANEEDLDQYLEAMRTALLEELHKGRRIRI